MYDKSIRLSVYHFNCPPSKHETQRVHHTNFSIQQSNSVQTSYDRHLFLVVELV